MRRIVVNVLDFDDELGRRLQGLVRVGVDDLGRQSVLGLLLAVQPLHGVNVAREFIDGEDGAGALARKDVLDVLAAHIQVCV